MKLEFSIIIPVYNRPVEIDELLKSITEQSFLNDFEVIVVEDGSEITSEKIVKKYQNDLNIGYYYKENSGPGMSRNFGMKNAKGNYFIILDSDCILPKQYLQEVFDTLTKNYTHAFGGPDTSHFSFTTIQKAINFSMTSVLTTGGIRGKKSTRNKFQPRSFNMGLSRIAFEKTKGFVQQNFGEDIDLTFRLWENGFDTQLIEKAYVYHKRRIDWISFLKQTFNFGAARPILNKQFQHSSKITYWFPSFFILGIVLAVILSLVGNFYLLIIFGVYFLVVLLDSLIKNRNLIVAVYSIWATALQFVGYGSGFLRSMIRLHLLHKPVKETFPKMFR